MAGMTDTAFRRLVKRHGGCGLVVTEMVSAEGLVRGIDRTLEYAEYTEEERPISIQIFGGDPDKMAAAAQIVEGMGADIVDVNMGCPVPKIAKHNAGCSLMREPAHAARGHRGDDEGGEDPRDRQDARRLERRRAERADAREDGRGRRRGGDRRPRPHRRAELQRLGRLGSRCRDRRRADDSGVRQRRLRRAGADRRADAIAASKACWSAAACCAIRGSWRRRPILPAGRPARDRDAGGARAVPARLHRAARCSERVRHRTERRGAIDATIAGSSTSCARWAPGTRRGSRTDLTCAPPSTAPSRSTAAAVDRGFLRRSFAAEI